MNIPENIVERDQLYSELVMKCTASQEERANGYGDLRSYYLFGGGGGMGSSPFNKIYPHIDLLTSFLFASETTKFMVHLGANAKEPEYARVPTMSRVVNDKWLDSNADRVVSHAITWALVNNTMMAKLIPRVNPKTKKVEINPFPVHPASFGVFREDIPFSDRQEAMVHTYYTTKSQLEIDLADHPNREKLLAELPTGGAVEEERSGGIGRLMMGAMDPLSQPNPVAGNVDLNFNSNIDYLPDVQRHDLVVIDELWVWDTKQADYRVVTKFKNGAVIYDRINFFLNGEHPFVQFCPTPLPFYFWGMSEVAGLAPLQDWYTERVMQIRKLLNLQVKPPTGASGFGGMADEKMYALFSEGGLFSDGGQGVQPGKIDRFPPQLPSDLFAVLKQIDEAFSEHSGLPNTVQGKGEVGVRSGKQTSELARLGSARIKKRSLVIEDALEKMATLYLKIVQKYDASVYQDETGASFSADQFTHDYVVKVDSHSNSPIFMEDKKSLAFEMMKEKMITRARAINIIDPPDKEIILREIKEIEAKEAAQQQAEAQGAAAKEGGGK